MRHNRQAAATVRAARRQDLDAIYRLACAGGSGLTNLPADRNALAAKLDRACRAIVDPAEREAGAPIMLVTELDGGIVGTGMIWARVGGDWPFYSYRLTRQAKISRAIGRTKAQMLLNLVNDFDGETEVGGLFIDPGARGHALGRLTARARYLFIAAHRPWFGRKAIAELRGYQGADGRSPVWEALGRHFYGMEFDEADRTGAIAGNQFIADLGPAYPIYVSLLPADAQAALGRPHDDGRPARDMLLAENFRDEGYVDIFDGGPTLVADIDRIATVAALRTSAVVAIDEVAAVPVMASTGQGADFRAASGLAAADGERVRLAPSLAAALRVGPGDRVWHCPA